MDTADGGIGKQRMKLKREMDTDYEDEYEHAGPWDEERKKKGAFLGTGSVKKGSAAGSGGAMRCCQAEKCTADLRDAKLYHRRHKVCEHHAKAHAVLVAGIRQRFCQQCSRFHELLEFDEAKRSCRRRLAGHNERRRKSTAESHVEGKEVVYGQVDERGRIKITIQENTSYKHFQIR